METQDHSTRLKSLKINMDDSIYGTFAEIGAGQEVARHFFQAGRASHTIAKTISAYDMTFSDEIYGKAGRYVCEDRLQKMLAHEFDLLEQRLSSQRGDKTRFFAFADTVATHSEEGEGQGRSHGWMGIRFQSQPGGGVNEIILHVKMWDRFRLQQQDALSVLGVNLVHMAFFPPESSRERIAALLENLSPQRIEVNMIRFSGPDLADLDNRILSLELVKQKLTDAVLFDSTGEVLHASDVLFHQPVFVLRGTFRPVTKANIEILQKGVAQFKKNMGLKQDPQILFEITMNSLTHGGKLDFEDFLQRVDTLGALGHKVLISDFYLFYQIKSYLRQATDQAIGMALGASHLEKMFDKSFYQSLPGGILEGMSRLFDERTKLFVYPYKSQNSCSSASGFEPPIGRDFLYKHLMQNQMIVDILGCDNVDAAIHSKDVRKMMAEGDSKWKLFVPSEVTELIERHHFFGCKSK